MIAFAIDYKVKETNHSAIIEARDFKSAKKKLGKKHGYKDSRMIKVIKSFVVGYF